MLSNYRLTIGNVTFELDDLPDKIELGGTQSLAIQKFPGGEFSTQVLGAYDDPISWSGTFYYTNALSNALKLDDMRIAGSVVKLSWGPITKDVIVSTFKFTPSNAYTVDYIITVQPVKESSLEGSENITGYVAMTYSDSGSVSSSTPTTVESQPAQPTIHTVVSGECLSTIALKEYQDSSLWNKIYEANTDQISDPNLIYPGQQLKIPNISTFSSNADSGTISQSNISPTPSVGETKMIDVNGTKVKKVWNGSYWDYYS